MVAKRNKKVAAAGSEPATQEKVKRNVVLVLRVKLKSMDVKRGLG